MNSIELLIISSGVLVILFFIVLAIKKGERDYANDMLFDEAEDIIIVNSCKNYTAEDIALIMTSGLSNRELALSLGRTEYAIQCKRNKLLAEKE